MVFAAARTIATRAADGRVVRDDAARGFVVRVRRQATEPGEHAPGCEQQQRQDEPPPPAPAPSLPALAGVGEDRAQGRIVPATGAIAKSSDLTIVFKRTRPRAR